MESQRCPVCDCDLSPVAGVVARCPKCELGLAARSCVGCGYDLKGTPASGACSECGLAVVSTLRVASMATSDPAWVERIAAGARWAAAAPLFGLGVFLLAIVQLLVAAYTGRLRISDITSLIPIGIAVFLCGWACCGFRAARLLATPHPLLIKGRGQSWIAQKHGLYGQVVAVFAATCGLSILIVFGVHVLVGGASAPGPTARLDMILGIVAVAAGVLLPALALVLLLLNILRALEVLRLLPRRDDNVLRNILLAVPVVWALSVFLIPMLSVLVLLCAGVAYLLLASAWWMIAKDVSVAARKARLFAESSLRTETTSGGSVTH